MNFNQLILIIILYSKDVFLLCLLLGALYLMIVMISGLNAPF